MAPAQVRLRGWVFQLAIGIWWLDRSQRRPCDGRSNLVFADPLDRLGDFGMVVGQERSPDVIKKPHPVILGYFNSFTILLICFMYGDS